MGHFSVADVDVFVLESALVTRQRDVLVGMLIPDALRCLFRVVRRRWWREGRGRTVRALVGSLFSRETSVRFDPEGKLLNVRILW